MAKVYHTKEDFKHHIRDVNKMVEELRNAQGVPSDSALYGLLLASSNALYAARLHYDEFDEEAEKSNQE